MDTFVVAVLDQRSTGNSTDSMTVGHVPCIISTVCSIFIRHGGAIVCFITGARQYSNDLPQRGLEIPCHCIFQTKDCELGEKARKIIYGMSENGSYEDVNNDDGPPIVVDNDGPPKVVK